MATTEVYKLQDQPGRCASSAFVERLNRTLRAHVPGLGRREKGLAKTKAVYPKGQIPPISKKLDSPLLTCHNAINESKFQRAENACEQGGNENAQAE